MILFQNKRKVVKNNHIKYLRVYYYFFTFISHKMYVFGVAQG